MSANVRLVNPAKSLTREQVESRQQRAIKFARDVAGDPELAHQIEVMTPEEYASKRKIRLENPTGKETDDMQKDHDEITHELRETNRLLRQSVELQLRGTSTEGRGKGNAQSTRLNNPNGDEDLSSLQAASASRRAERLGSNLDEALDAIEDAQAALDDDDVNEAQRILQEVLGDYESDEDAEGKDD